MVYDVIRAQLSITIQQHFVLTLFYNVHITNVDKNRVYLRIMRMVTPETYGGRTTCAI